jgi:hypothetical protein
MNEKLIGIRLVILVLTVLIDGFERLFETSYIERFGEVGKESRCFTPVLGGL